MKAAKGFYYLGLSLSLLVGLWHFFVPAIFQWHSYIPSQYENLIVGIDWTNFFFSLLLSGTSLLLIVMGKRFFCGNKETLIFYTFFVFVWLCRVAITFIVPWPLEPVAWAAWGQQIAAFCVFACLFVPLFYQLICLRQQGRPSKS